MRFALANLRSLYDSATVMCVFPDPMAMCMRVRWRLAPSDFSSPLMPSFWHCRSVRGSSCGMLFLSLDRSVSGCPYISRRLAGRWNVRTSLER